MRHSSSFWQAWRHPICCDVSRSLPSFLAASAAALSPLGRSFSACFDLFCLLVGRGLGPSPADGEEFPARCSKRLHTSFIMLL